MLSIRKAPLFRFEVFEMSHFSHFHWKFLKIIYENRDTSNILNIKKWGISNKNHKTSFQTAKGLLFKEPKLQLFDFEAFPIKNLIPSHDKIIFYMLFVAFQNTSRIWYILSYQSILLLNSKNSHLALLMKHQQLDQDEDCSWLFAVVLLLRSHWFWKGMFALKIQYSFQIQIA